MARKKVAGAAQRKTKKGFLHQGTIALVMPSVGLLDQILLPRAQVKEAMLAVTLPLLQDGATEEQMRDVKSELKRLLTTQLTVPVVS